MNYKAHLRKESPKVGKLGLGSNRERLFGMEKLFGGVFVVTSPLTAVDVVQGRCKGADFWQLSWLKRQPSPNGVSPRLNSQNSEPWSEWNSN